MFDKPGCMCSIVEGSKDAYRRAQWLRRTKPEAQMSKCAFEYFADIIKVLQINCLIPNWHGIVSLSFRFTLPALLPSQHIDCALLALQTPLSQASYSLCSV